MKIQSPYPNQKMTKIMPDNTRLKSTDNPEGDTFIVISSTAARWACQTLNEGSALVLYIYLCDNKDNHILGLSPKAISKKVGLTEKQYRKAVETLEEKGYLKPAEKSKDGNNYEFYRLPPQYECMDIDEYLKQQRKTSGNKKCKEALPEQTPTDVATDNIDVSIPKGVYTSKGAYTPKGIDNLPQKGGISTPKGIDNVYQKGDIIYPKRYRETLYTVNNNINNINNNIGDIANPENKDILNCGNVVAYLEDKKDININDTAKERNNLCIWESDLAEENSGENVKQRPTEYTYNSLVEKLKEVNITKEYPIKTDKQVQNIASEIINLISFEFDTGKVRRRCGKKGYAMNDIHYVYLLVDYLKELHQQKENKIKSATSNKKYIGNINAPAAVHRSENEKETEIDEDKLFEYLEDIKSVGGYPKKDEETEEEYLRRLEEYGEDLPF